MKTTIRIAGAIVLICVIMYSCQEELQETKRSLPRISTINVSEVDYTTAVSGGMVISDGGSPVISRGVCWNTTGVPTLSDDKVTGDGGTGMFVTALSGLIPGTKYYVRAFATNDLGTVYGSEYNFTTNHILIASLLPAKITSSAFNSVILRSEIAGDNGAPVTSRGVCWNSAGTPSILDFKTSDGSGTGVFSSYVTGLNPSATYYARTYAINSKGIAYNDAIIINTPPIPYSDIIFNPNLQYGSLSDIDGNTYKTIQIGTQTWMAENLRTTRFNDGTAIPLITDQTKWDTMNSSAFCWYNNDSEAYFEYFGALYNWYTVNTGKLCPSGWHLPNDSDWNALTTLLGGTSIAGGKMKETGNAHWLSSNAGATNETGFSAIPAGFHGVGWYTPFVDIGYSCYLWSSAESQDVKIRYIVGNETSLINFEDEFLIPDPRMGCSVRCLKN